MASIGKRAAELGGIGGGAEQTGSALVDGIIAGINAKSAELAQALGNVLAGALSGAQRDMGIASPSKLFALEVGLPIGQGVAEGIAASLPLALGAMNDLSAGLVRPAAPAVARSQSVVTNYNSPQYIYQPQYNGAPRQPTQDFAALRAFAAAR